jgi:hypothetical protein
MGSELEKGERERGQGGVVWGKSRGATGSTPQAVSTGAGGGQSQSESESRRMGLVTSSRPAVRWYMYHRASTAEERGLPFHEMNLTWGSEQARQPFTGSLSKTGRAHLSFI